MSDRMRRILPLLAAVGLVLVVGLLILCSNERRTLLVDTGETRQAVEGTLQRLQDLQPDSLEAPEFQAAAEQAAHEPYVATLWLVAPNGQIVYSAGSTARQGQVADQVGAETQRVLAILPDDALSAEQRMELMMASAMQVEGEHNDIYRHLLRPLHASGGTLLGWVGVAYDVSPALSSPPNVLWILCILFSLLGLGLYWLSLPVWVWLDARQRGERAWVWGIFVLLGNLVALLAYLLVRAPRRESA